MRQHVPIVTGASRGVGRATAVELSRRGGAVAIVARDQTDLAETARLCEAAGGTCLARPADITSESDLSGVAQKVVDTFGGIDGVVNNAGYAPQAGVEETDATLFDRTLAVNLTAAMTLSRLAWPHLRQSGTAGRRPVIVNVSSMSAIDPLPGFVAYAAAKAGLLGLTRALAREGDAEGIRSVAIILGGVETAMFRGLKGVEGVPTEALLTPEEAGHAIAECLLGPFAYASGEGIYLRKRI